MHAARHPSPTTRGWHGSTPSRESRRGAPPCQPPGGAPGGSTAQSPPPDRGGDHGRSWPRHRHHGRCLGHPAQQRGRRPVDRSPGSEPAAGTDLCPADDHLRPLREGGARPIHTRGPARRHLCRCPAAGPRRGDDGRGPDVLVEQRLRHAGHRVGGRPGRERGRRARRVDDHPATGPRPPAPARGDRTGRRPLPAQGQGTHPVDAPVRDVPGRAGQGAGHHRLSQRDLLRPRRLRDRGRGAGLFRRQRPGQADAGAGRAPGRSPQIAVDARPIPLCGRRQEGTDHRPRRLRSGDPARLGPARVG